MHGGHLPSSWLFGKLGVSEACGPHFDPLSRIPEEPSDSASAHGETLTRGDTAFSDSKAGNGLDDVLRIQEYERRRLGQELHDSTGQLLVSLQFGVSRLRSIAEESGQGGLIEEIRDTIRQIDQQIRSLSFLEYPVELGDRDLGTALRLLALGFGRRTGVRTTFKVVGEVAALGMQTSMALLRVAQEALVNIHRHSRATSAKVLLKVGLDSVQLTISDDGAGLPELAESSEGLGLRGMRHRAETLGGRFRISNLKHGVRVSATMPLG